jgi:uncharacterized cupin superfamily protein
MNKPIINLADAPSHSDSSGERFAYTMSELADPLGAKSIGANVTRVPPGKAAFPFHHHHANEEHFFILSGVGVLRLGTKIFEVKQHDYIVNLPGGADHAHQLINTGTEDLVYLAISTLIVPEVAGYPDSRKTGVRIAYRQDAAARFLVDDTARNSVSYWQGEDGARVAEILARHR